MVLEEVLEEVRRERGVGDVRVGDGEDGGIRGGEEELRRDLEERRRDGEAGGAEGPGGAEGDDVADRGGVGVGAEGEVGCDAGEDYGDGKGDDDAPAIAVGRRRRR